MTTSEFARQTGATLRQLQYWDEHGFLKPFSRSHGGHRVYRPIQVPLGRRLRMVSETGLKLEQWYRRLMTMVWHRVEVIDGPVAIGGVLYVPIYKVGMGTLSAGRKSGPKAKSA